MASYTLSFDSHFVEAKLALGRVGPGEMPALAWDALEAGFDGPFVRRLAALVNPSGWETDQILPAFMREAGLVSISKQEACIRIARHLARRILTLGLDPLNHTRDFELLWIEADHPAEIQEAGCLDDEKHVANIVGQTESGFREYALGVLAKLAADDEASGSWKPELKANS